jgi:ubiquinone/menaquinone biosynthesis C-methylase UbiE
MKNARLNATYDVWSESYDEFANPLIPIEEMTVRSLFRTMQFVDVLDAATGTGRYALELARQGKRVRAVDCNAKMLSRAREKALRDGLDIEFRQEDLSEISFPEASFDLVLCALALAHVQDLTQPCREFMRVLRPGGNLVITDLHPSMQRKMGADYMWELAEGHSPVFFPNRHSDVDDYLKAVSSAGGKVLAALDVPMELEGHLIPGALVIWAGKPVVV